MTKPKSVEFTIPKLPLSLNIMLRSHKMKLLQEQNSWNWWLHSQWISHNKLMFQKPVRIKYTIVFKNNRQRDFDNYMGGTKYILDAIRRTFITRDDYLWVRGITIDFETGRDETRVLIEEVAE